MEFFLNGAELSLNFLSIQYWLSVSLKAPSHLENTEAKTKIFCDVCHLFSWPFLPVLWSFSLSLLLIVNESLLFNEGYWRYTLLLQKRRIIFHCNFNFITGYFCLIKFVWISGGTSSQVRCSGSSSISNAECHGNLLLQSTTRLHWQQLPGCAILWGIWHSLLNKNTKFIH